MLNQKLPTGRAFKDFMNLLRKYTPHFYDSFNNDDRKIIESHTGDYLPVELQDKLIDKANKDKTLQVAIARSTDIDKEHFQKLCDTFLYKDTRLEVLKSPYISEIENYDHYIKKMLSTVSPKSLYKLLDEEGIKVNHSVISYIVTDVIDKAYKDGKIDCLEDYQLKAFSLYKNALLNQQVFIMLSRTQDVPEELISSIINNPIVSSDNRQYLYQRGYNPKTVEIIPPHILQEMYQGAVETLFEIDKSDKTSEADKLAEEFLTKAITQRMLPESLEVDLTGRLLNTDGFRYGSIPINPLLKTLMAHTNYDTVLQFYSSGALSKGDKYRALVYENEHMPEETVSTLALIALDNIKDNGELKEDEFRFFIKQCYNDKFMERVYEDVLAYKDSGQVELHLNDNGFEQIKHIMENMAISPYTPNKVLKELQSVYYGHIVECATLTLNCRKEDVEIHNYFEVFQNKNSTLFAGKSDFKFNMNESLINKDFYLKLKQILEKTMEEVNKDTYIQNVRKLRKSPDSVDIMLSQLNLARATSLFKIDLERKQIDEMIQEIKNETSLFNVYKNFNNYVDRLHKIKDLSENQKLQQQEMIEETKAERKAKEEER